MQSFKTNDNVTLKYIDTGATDLKEARKPMLIMASLSQKLQRYLLQSLALFSI